MKKKQNLQGKAIHALMRVYSSPLVEKLKLRNSINKLTYAGVKLGFKSTSAINKRLKKKQGVEQGKHSQVFNVMPSEEQQMVCNGIERFNQQHIRPASYAADTQASMPAELYQSSLDLGLIYLALPESLGGVSDNYAPVTSILVAEKLAWGDLGMAYAILAPLAFANAIRRWGTQEQQSRYLSPFFESNVTPFKAAIAVQETHIGCHPHQLMSKAKKRNKGFVINGEKVLLPWGGQANEYLVAAMYNNQPRVFIVPATAKGVSWIDTPSMGLKSAQIGTLKLDSVYLDKQALLGGTNKKEFDYQRFLDFGALHVAALAVGCSQAVLDYVVPYINEREAFGEPISQRQSVAFMAADMALEIEGMRLLLWRAASRAEQGLDFHKEAALALHLCSQKGMQVGTNGVQLLGGHGFTKEHPVERWYRDLRSIAIIKGMHA